MEMKYSVLVNVEGDWIAFEDEKERKIVGPSYDECHNLSKAGRIISAHTDRIGDLGSEEFKAAIANQIATGGFSKGKHTDAGDHVSFFQVGVP